MRNSDSIYLRLRHKAREGHPRADELNAAAEAMVESYDDYRARMYDRVSAEPTRAFDRYLAAVRHGQELLEEVSP